MFKKTMSASARNSAATSPSPAAFRFPSIRHLIVVGKKTNRKARKTDVHLEEQMDTDEAAVNHPVLDDVEDKQGSTTCTASNTPVPLDFDDEDDGIEPFDLDGPMAAGPKNTPLTYATDAMDCDALDLGMAASEEAPRDVLALWPATIFQEMTAKPTQPRAVAPADFFRSLSTGSEPLVGDSNDDSGYAGANTPGRQAAGPLYKTLSY